jgi:hypothetical protein
MFCTKVGLSWCGMDQKGAAKLLHLRKNKTADLVAGCLYDLISCSE